MTLQEYIKYLESEYSLVEKAKGEHSWHGGCEFMLRLAIQRAKEINETTSIKPLDK